jgi:hypothetical protein
MSRGSGSWHNFKLCREAWVWLMAHRHDVALGNHGGPIRRPERGWMGADKKFFSNGVTSQTRKTRSDTQNHTLRMQPSVCQNHIATKVLLVLGTNTTGSLDSYTHTAAETTREQAVWRGRLDRVWGRLDRLHQTIEKFSETPLQSTKTHHGFTNRNLWSRPS